MGTTGLLLWLLACGDDPVPPPAAPRSPAFSAAWSAVSALEPTLAPDALVELCAADRCRYRLPLAEAVDEQGFADELAVLLAGGEWAASEVSVHTTPEGGAQAAFTLRRILTPQEATSP